MKFVPIELMQACIAHPVLGHYMSAALISDRALVAMERGHLDILLELNHLLLEHIAHATLHRIKTPLDIEHIALIMQLSAHIQMQTRRIREVATICFIEMQECPPQLH